MNESLLHRNKCIQTCAQPIVSEQVAILKSLNLPYYYDF